MKISMLKSMITPFAYITQISWHAFIAYINKEKQNQEQKKQTFWFKRFFKSRLFTTRGNRLFPMANVVLNENCEYVEETSNDED